MGLEKKKKNLSNCLSNKFKIMWIIDNGGNIFSTTHRSKQKTPSCTHKHPHKDKSGIFENLLPSKQIDVKNRGLFYLNYKLSPG